MARISKTEQLIILALYDSQQSWNLIVSIAFDTREETLEEISGRILHWIKPT